MFSIVDPYSGNNPLQTDYARTVQTSGPYGLPPAGFSMPIQPEFLSNPVLTNAAMQYGQALMGSGTKIVNKEIEKYVPVSRLKYYFAVDTSYVRRKLSILFFPYLHAVSLKKNYIFLEVLGIIFLMLQIYNSFSRIIFLFLYTTLF